MQVLLHAQLQSHETGCVLKILNFHVKFASFSNHLTVKFAMSDNLETGRVSLFFQKSRWWNSPTKSGTDSWQVHSQIHDFEVDHVVKPACVLRSQCHYKVPTGLSPH